MSGFLRGVSAQSGWLGRILQWTRKALAAHLYSHFSKKMPETEVQYLIDRLIASGQLSEANGRITYHF